MNRRWILLAVLVAGFAAGIFGARFLSELTPAAQGRETDETFVPLDPESLDAFPAVAKRVSPSVVNIGSTVVRFHEIDDIFERLFGGGVPREETQVGTGFVVDREGHILTNYHVIQGAEGIRATLSDKREFLARVVGVDPETDTALLRIEAEKLQPVVLGDSDKLRVGEWVIAIGNPFGLDHTVTAGIVSAMWRSNVTNFPYQGYIQTDAAINPGNSGGPLVNLRGEVVGMSAAIWSRSGGYQGVGFAIPVNRLKFVMKELMEQGKVVRGFLGIQMIDISHPLVHYVNQELGLDLEDIDDLLRFLKLTEPRGAFVLGVLPGSPANGAGIRQGDVIVEYQGQKVVDVQVLNELVATTPVGGEATLKISRDGKIVELRAEVARKPVEAIRRRR